jgi:integration host factor subunit beta
MRGAIVVRLRFCTVRADRLWGRDDGREHDQARGSRMTKSELIERISQKLPRVPKRDVEAIVQTIFDSMLGALQRRQRIEIRGFGSFAIKTRRPREGRNPKTGQKVHVPSRRTPYFTVGKELRDRLNPQQRMPVVARPAGNYSSIGASPVQSLAAASETGPRYPIR